MEISLVESHQEICVSAQCSFQDHFVIRIAQERAPKERSMHWPRHRDERIQQFINVLNRCKRYSKLLRSLQHSFVFKRQGHGKKQFKSPFQGRH